MSREQERDELTQALPKNELNTGSAGLRIILMSGTQTQL